MNIKWSHGKASGINVAWNGETKVGYFFRNADRTYHAVTAAGDTQTCSTYQDALAYVENSATEA